MEERWRGLDPLQQNPANTKKFNHVNSKVVEQFEDCETEHQMLDKLEYLSKEHLKIPLKKENNFDNIKINRLSKSVVSDLSFQKEMKAFYELNASSPGGVNPYDSINKILRHDYLRRGMENRLANKNQLKKNEKLHKEMMKTKSRETKGQILRDQSVKDQLQKLQEDPYQTAYGSKLNKTK